MARNSDYRQVNFLLTPEQHQAAIAAINEDSADGMGELMRRALINYAAQLGIVVPNNYPGRGQYPRSPEPIQSFTFWKGDERPENPAHDVEWVDSEGFCLRLLEREGEDVSLDDPELLSCLEEYGYNGPHDWSLA